MSTIGNISYRTKWLVSKRYIQAIIVIGLMTLGVAIPFFTPHRAFGAVTDIGCTTPSQCNFELDGNIYHNSGATSTTLPEDWGGCTGNVSCTTGRGLFDANGNTNPLPTGGLDAHWVNDGPHKSTDNTTFTTGSKDTLDISNAGWQCVPSSNITPKDDILHTYSFAMVSQSPSTTGDIMVYAGMERFANNGAGDIGLWLLQSGSVDCNASSGKTTSFMGAHQVNDTLIVAEFSTGGTVTTINTFRWVGISKAFPLGVANITTAGGGDCQTVGTSANICARSNTGPISTLPWSSQDKTSTPNTLATAEFFEVGIDLSRLFGGSLPCVNRFLFDTRTSPSLTATLVDFAVGALTTCKPSISTSVSPSTIALGGSATDTATVTLTPSGTVSGTVDFKVYGPVATNSSTCTNLATSFTGVSIGPGASPQSATSPAFTPLSAGYYFWTATYNPASSANGQPASTSCGDTGESLLVIGTRITTSVSPTPITLGGSATDNATVTLTPSSATVLGTVTFNVYGPFTSTPTSTSCTAGSLVKTFSPNTKSIGPATGSASVTSDPFTPSSPGNYAWIATYNPTGVANGPTNSTRCGDSGEILVVFGIPKITAFDFTNTPTHNDPTLGSGSVTYSFTIHNYGASAVTLSGSFTVLGPSVTCTPSSPLTLSGSLTAFGSSGDSLAFSTVCSYSGTTGQQVSATIDAMFTVAGGVAHEVSGSPATYTFTIEQV